MRFLRRLGVTSPLPTGSLLTENNGSFEEGQAWTHKEVTGVRLATNVNKLGLIRL